MKDRVVGNTDRKGNQHTSIDDNPFPPSLLGLVNERVEKYPDPTRASLGTHAEPSPPFSFARFHTALAVYPPDLVPSRKGVVGCHAGAHARRSIKKKKKEEGASLGCLLSLPQRLAEHRSHSPGRRVRLRKVID